MQKKKTPRRYSFLAGASLGDLPELATLDAYRTVQGWSFALLARDMQRAGVQMSGRTLHYLIRVAPRDKHARDVTISKIRKYLKFVADNTEATARALARASGE